MTPRFISQLESKHVEVEENVYNLLVNLMSATDTMEYYRHYKISQRKIVTVKSEFAVISAGTTGLSIWEVGIRFCALMSYIHEDSLNFIIAYNQNSNLLICSEYLNCVHIASSALGCEHYFILIVLL